MSSERSKSPDFSPRWLEIVLGIIFVFIGISCLALEILLLLNSPKFDIHILPIVVIFTLVALFSFKVSYRTFKRRPKASGSIQCSNCFATTEIEDSFFNQRRLFGTSFRRFCPLCWNKMQLSNKKWSYLFSLSLSLGGLLLLIFNPDSKLGYLLINLFLLYVIEIASCILHELAHAWTAKKLGYHVFKISIGHGKNIYTGKIFGFDIELNSIPVMGMVLAAYPGKLSSKSKPAMYALSGPLMNLILAFIGFLMIPSHEAWNFGKLLHHISPLHVLFYSNLLLLVRNLWPGNVMTTLGPVGTDGKQLLKSFSMKDEDIDAQHSAWFLWEGIDRYRKKLYSEAEIWFEKGLEHYPDNYLLTSYLGQALIRQCEFSAARNCYMKALSQTKDPNQQALMKNNIAYVDALSGDATLLQEADTYSQDAMAILSWFPAIKGTRGTVLLELKQIDEAILFLTDALRLSSELDGKAENCCFLAIAEANRGNFSKGNMYLMEALKLDPNCFLLKRAEDALVDKSHGATE